MGRWLVLFSVLVWSQIATAQDAPKPSQDVIFILDASGSMWGRVDDEIKMDVAKSVSTQTIADLSDAANIGVMAYGHRTEGDCDDIETLVTLTGSSSNTVNAAIEGLQPKGKTPLTQAVRRASDSLKNRGSNTSIVLITDGLETCGGDPCALGRELAASGTGLRTHIVGFDLVGRNTSALQCLAAETGGTYSDASDRTELTQALKKTVKDIHDNRPQSLPTLAPPAILTTPAPVLGNPNSETKTAKNGTLKLTARLSETSDVLKRPVLEWELFQKNDSGARISVGSEPGIDPIFELPSGNYMGRVSGEDMSADFVVSVTGGELTSKTITLNAGFVRIVPKGQKGVTSILVLQNGTEVAREAVTPRGVKLLLSAGNYEIVGTLKDETAKASLSLIAGDDARVDLDFSKD